MVTVASLLNPLPPAFGHQRDCADLVPRRRNSVSPPLSQPSRKQKMARSGSTWVKSKPKGTILYQPCEHQDDVIAAEHERFEVEPVGHITDYPRHIPYNSEKKSFQLKTGRDAFEAYQYTFRMPDDDRGRDAHVVMWDYNVGLVRVTPFFKSLKHTKTMPAKVMNANPGLKEISHSITGGSIGAQGYWVPYEAAKAIAATFCYEIRYALTPVFGVEFPEMCIEPDDPAFQRVSINPDIILRCTAAANASRAESREASLASSPSTSYPTPMLSVTPKVLRPKPGKILYAESGYCTDSDQSSLLNSPVSGSSGWTAVNVRTPIPRSHPDGNYRFPTPSPTDSKSAGSRRCEFPSHKEKRSVKHHRPEEDETSDAGSSWGTRSIIQPPRSAKRRKVFTTLTQEARAAYTLMQLHMADAAIAERKGPKPRRASH